MQGVVVRGIDPDTEAKVTGLARNMTAGTLKDLENSDSKLPGIIIGDDLARKLGVSVGDTVTMVNPLGEETPMGLIPKMKKFVVAGLFDAGMYDYNITFVYIALPDAQKFFDMKGRISGIQVRIDDVYHGKYDFVRYSKSRRVSVYYP